MDRDLLWSHRPGSGRAASGSASADSAGAACRAAGSRAVSSRLLGLADGGGNGPGCRALDLLAMILTEGDASRLMQALVIKSHVAVDVNAANDTGEMGGRFQISATVAPGTSVSGVESLIGEEIARLRSVPVSNDELARVKAKYRTEMLMSLTAPLRRTLVIGLGLAQHGDPHYYQSLFSRYEKVTVTDLDRVARQHLSPDQVILVIEPVGKDEEPSPAVLVGPLPSDEHREPLEPRAAPAGPDWSVMPQAAPGRLFTPPPFQRRRLSNGLELWMATWRTLPLITAQLVVRAGVATQSARPGRSGRPDRRTLGPRYAATDGHRVRRGGRRAGNINQRVGGHRRHQAGLHGGNPFAGAHVDSGGRHGCRASIRGGGFFAGAESAAEPPEKRA